MNPGHQDYMFNSQFRDAINKLEVDMEQQKTVMEQQKMEIEQLRTEMEHQKSTLEQQAKGAEQQMALQQKTMEHQMEQLKTVELMKATMEQHMEQQKTAMELQKLAMEQQAVEHKTIKQQMEQQNKTVNLEKTTMAQHIEQQKAAMEQPNTTMDQRTKGLEQQIELHQKTMEQYMKQQKALEPLTPAGRKKQLDAAFNKLPEERPDWSTWSSRSDMQQAQAGSSGHRLHVACQLGEKKLVESLLDEYPDSRDKAEFINTRVDRWYALMCACIAGHADVVSLLITSGADVTVRDWLGSTGLMFASLRGHVSVVRVLLDSFTDDKKRADYFNIQDTGGRSALSYATTYKHKDVVDLLRKSGAKRKT